MSEENKKIERISENHVKLTVTVSDEVWAKALDNAFEKVVKQVKVDGFRPGKLPKQMFLQRYGYESLYQEAVDEVLNITYPEAAMSFKIYPTADPKFDFDATKLSPEKGFDYTAEVDVWPEVHLGEYKGLVVKPLSKRVYKKDIDAYVETELKKKAKLVSVDTPAENGNTVVIDFEGFLDGVPFEGGKGEKYPLELGSNSFIPGFEEQLVGVTKGSSKDVNVAFPKDYQAKDLAGKEVVFKCLVHEVQANQVPKLTDEIVQEYKIDGVDTCEKYLEYVKDTLTKQKTKASDDQYINDLVQAVCKASYADFPQSLIDAEVGADVKKLQDQSKQYNIPEETMLSYMGIKSLDDFKAKSTERVKQGLLQELVFDKIIEVEKLDATPEEIEKEFEVFAKVNENDSDKVKSKKLADAKKQVSERQVAYKIKAGKVLDLLKANASSK